MALFSRKNIKNCKDQSIIDEFNEWLDYLFIKAENGDRIPITEVLKKNNYELSKELYSILNNKEYGEKSL